LGVRGVLHGDAANLNRSRSEKKAATFQSRRCWKSREPT
jgi:hypothetical protein